MRKRELYSKLWRIADYILKENKPCQLQKDSQGHWSCVKSRAGKIDASLCCSGCKHLGRNGCKVQSLNCKLGACYTYPGRLPMIANNATLVNTSLAMLAEAAEAAGIKLYASARHSKTEYFVFESQGYAAFR